MSRSVICALFIASYVCALPTEVDVNEPFSILLQDAQATVAKLKSQGVQEADCQDLALTMCKDIEDTITTDQALLNSLPTGSQCESEGASMVATAQETLTTKTQAHENAVTASNSAHSESVSFHSQTFSSVNVDQCDHMFAAGTDYAAKKTAHDAAVVAENVAKGAKEEAERVHAGAVAAAQRLKDHCLCTTKHDMEFKWKALIAPRADQEKAHKKCKMMKCVLDGTNTAADQCKSNLAALTKPTLSSGADNASCDVSYVATKFAGSGYCKLGYAGETPKPTSVTVNSGVYATTNVGTSTLTHDAKSFSDRSYVFRNIPSALEGMQYIQGPVTSRGNSFTVNVSPASALVYVIASVHNHAARLTLLDTNLLAGGFRRSQISGIDALTTTAMPQGPGFKVWEKTTNNGQVTVHTTGTITMTVLVAKPRGVQRIWKDGKPISGTQSDNTGYTKNTCRQLCSSVPDCQFVTFQDEYGGQCHMTKTCPEWQERITSTTWQKTMAGSTCPTGYTVYEGHAQGAHALAYHGDLCRVSSTDTSYTCPAHCERTDTRPYCVRNGLACRRFDAAAVRFAAAQDGHCTQAANPSSANEINVRQSADGVSLADCKNTCKVLTDCMGIARKASTNTCVIYGVSRKQHFPDYTLHTNGVALDRSKHLKGTGSAAWKCYSKQMGLHTE